MSRLRLALSVLLAVFHFSGCVEFTDKDDAQKRIELSKLELWSRGAFSLDEHGNIADHVADSFERLVVMAPIRLGPVRSVRRDILRDRQDPSCDMNGYCSIVNRFRGGSQDIAYSEEQLDIKIKELGVRFGQAFLDAIEQNKKEHHEDCVKSCELYYCGSPDSPLVPLEDLLNQTSIAAYSMGSGKCFVDYYIVGCV
jgi:hypothetical protein